ncbi:transcriptional regulator, TrmB [Methanococcus vannielii SB]|uniref:Transcriptional regulator, TrmB n=1 Tax=Methanococcus vannielii (strain ATCC 35089 / DSM 1224 / JCM 13029 / OCM 148 / SB) TaxID=406327 RepID=A6USC4_METVS|nr:winged helix-turn-helix domain-containing protein [Methanococcus vannielii]ABR55396.1 transcriptional regulator, TrmB [Methanococcus vannielii SB]
MKTIEDIDKKLIGNISSLLSSEVRAKIYMFLRKYPNSTVDEIADGTGIYPSTIRESIFEMYNENYVLRKKMEREGLGKKPYLYSAIAPSEMVKIISDAILVKLNDLALLDEKINGEDVTEVSKVSIELKSN